MTRTRHELHWPGLYIELDPSRQWARPAGYRYNAPPTMEAGQGRLVHVMSTHAMGEIRAYVLDSARVLHLRPPCYTGLWADMDAEVSRVLGATVAPYAILPGGCVVPAERVVHQQGTQITMFPGVGA